MPYQVTLWAQESFGEWTGYVALREAEPDASYSNIADRSLAWFHVGHFEDPQDALKAVMKRIAAQL